MSKQYKFDLCQRCYKFSLSVINLSEMLPKKRSAWIIEDQLIRSATSVGANLFEAKASSSRLEFKKFNEISLKSANETKYWLSILKDAGFIETKIIDQYLEEITQISNMIASGIIKLKNK